MLKFGQYKKGVLKQDLVPDRTHESSGTKKNEEEFLVVPN
jgi:hypothetical protein